MGYLFNFGKLTANSIIVFNAKNCYKTNDIFYGLRVMRSENYNSKRYEYQENESIDVELTTKQDTQAMQTMKFMLIEWDN